MSSGANNFWQLLAENKNNLRSALPEIQEKTYDPYSLMLP